jgi:hypothetical protein
MASTTKTEKKGKRRDSMDYMEESDSDSVERPELSRETSPLPEELKPESEKFSRAKLRG